MFENLIPCGIWLIFLVVAGGLFWVIFIRPLLPSEPEPYNGYLSFKEPEEEKDVFSEEDEKEWDSWQEAMIRREEEYYSELSERVKRQIDERKRQEQEAVEIARDFPAWLIKFGNDYGGVCTYKGLVELSKYIGAILMYAQDNFDGRLPIKRCYQVINEGKGFGYRSPNNQCQGRIFFEQLSKTLEKNGILGKGRGIRAKLVQENALLKLRPGSSVQ